MGVGTAPGPLIPSSPHQPPLRSAGSRFMLRLCFTACLVVLASFSARADDVIPADAPPRWWKGNLHTHTFWSDGDDFPEMVAEWYRTHDYNFLGLSDHNVLQQGQRWRTRADLEKKAAAPVIEKYLKRFGPEWV